MEYDGPLAGGVIDRLFDLFDLDEDGREQYMLPLANEATSLAATRFSLFVSHSLMMLNKKGSKKVRRNSFRSSRYGKLISIAISSLFNLVFN